MGRQSVRSILFGSRLRTAGTIILTLAVLGGGAVAAGVFGAPSVESIDNEFGAVNESETEILTAMTVENPNPLGAGSADLSAEYVVSMNGIEMAEGGSERLRLESGESVEYFSTQMQNDRIPEWWVSHIENGEETTVDIDARVSSGRLGRGTGLTTSQAVETDLLSEFNSTETRPVNASAPVVEDPVLYINETRAEWGEVDAEQTGLDLRFDIYNPKTYDIPLSQISYTISMNDVVIGEGESDREYLLESKQVTDVETTTRIENGNLDEWWVTHLQNNETSELRIEFEAQFEVSPGRVVTVPLDALTYEETVETDIWGTKDEAGSIAESMGRQQGESGASNNATGETPTESDAGGTPTESDEATPTETDDGIVSGGETETEIDETTPTETDDGIVSGGGTETETDETTPTQSDDEATPTETDDGILPGDDTETETEDGDLPLSLP